MSEVMTKIQTTQSALIERKSITKNNNSFGLRYIKIYKEKPFKLVFNTHHNIVSFNDIKDSPCNITEIMNLVKFCLTGKNDNTRHLMEKGIEAIETCFYTHSSEYIIRIFSEYQYKAFLIKLNKNNRLLLYDAYSYDYNDEDKYYETVITKCVGLKEIQERIIPKIKQILEVSDDITLPQFFRLFYLNDKNSLQRIISEKEYNKMTTLLLNNIIDKATEILQDNPDKLISLLISDNEKLTFLNYSINFIEDKIERLNKQEEFEIKTIKNNLEKEIKKNLISKIEETKKEIKKTEEQKILLKRKLSNIKNIGKAKYSTKNQFLLFNDTFNKKNEEKTIKDKLRNLKIEFSHTTLRLNYLNSTLEELNLFKSEITEKYKEKIMLTIANFQERILLERINIETLLEKKKEIINNNENNKLTSINIRKKIIQKIENLANKYLYISKSKFNIKLNQNLLPFLYDKDGLCCNIDSLSTNEKIVVSLSFHLGLMNFSANYIYILPPLLIINISNANLKTTRKIEDLIRFLIKKTKNNSMQIVMMYPQRELLYINE